MSTSETRECFERFFSDSRRNRGAKHPPSFDRRDDGTYADDHTQRHWWTWQQALAAQERAEPVAFQSRFVENGASGWAPCSREHYELVTANPHDWKGYECRALYANPPAAQPAQPVADYLLSADEQGVMKRALFSSAKVLDERPVQPVAVPDERKTFESWYVGNAFDFVRNPIGSRDCGLQWSAWQARATLAAAPAAPKREPLTKAQIGRAYRNAPSDVAASLLLSELAFYHLFRYVEACHGITKES